MQYLEFNAFDFGPAADDRGMVSYTNFDYPLDGTGVWTVKGDWSVAFVFGGTYTHNLSITMVKPMSPTSMWFAGTGVYAADSTYTSDVVGMVDGSSITFRMTYTGTNAGYWVDVTGTIAPDGSMSGTALSSTAQAMTWTTAAGSVHEVLRYTAPVNCAAVSGTQAQFSYVIPEGIPGLSGTSIIWKVTDGGSPAVGNDTAGFAVSTASCDVGITPTLQTLAGGNLVVH